MGYLRRRFRTRRIRKSKAEFLAQLDEARKHEGSFNRSQSFDVSSYYWESGIGGGPYYCVKQANKDVSRNMQRGDFKTTTPYRKTVYELNGSTEVGFKTSVTGPYGTYTDQKRWRSYADASVTWWGGYDVSQGMRNSLVNSSQTALLAKMRRMAPTWDILTSAAELGETLSSIKGAATWFATLIKHVSARNIPSILRHLRLKKTKANKRKIVSCYTDSNGFNHYYSSAGSVPFQQLDVMQNLWMSYRYSMMTTIYDMQDAMIALAAPKRAKDYELTAQVTLKDGYSSSGSLGWVPCFGGTDTLVNYSESLSINGSIRKNVWFSFYEDILSRLDPNTIISMCKTAWELVPFSWVADWFLDISGYLQLAELDSLIPKSDVCVTERGSVRLAYYLTGYKVNVPDSPGYSGSTKLVEAPGSGVSIGNSFYFDRSAGSIYLPSWSPSESWYTWKRGLDAASLSWQKVKNSLHEYLPKVRV